MSKMRPTTEFRKPAVFLVNGLGDQLLAIPAMRALATIFPDGIQLLLGEGLYAFPYRGLPVGEPARVWWADEERWGIDVARIMADVRPCDVFLSLSSWATEAVMELAKKMGAAWSIGYTNVFDEVVPYDASHHMFDELFGLPQCFRKDLRVEDFCQMPEFSGAAERAAERFVRERIKTGERILFLHPETRENKMWHAEGFAWVLEHFLDAHPEFKVFIAHVRPYPLEMTRHRERVCPVNVHFELALAIMKRVDLYLGVDSCFLHAADLFRLPGVGLFGPANHMSWGFRLSPHGRIVCANGPMDTLDREAVLEALMETSVRQTELIGVAMA
jgi:ADP-heptose:LPS heptosyltransferase